MESGPSLVVTLLIGLAIAYVGGLAARALRLPPIVGYLLAGVAVGPSTLGVAADLHTVEELAQIGVVLLLFGVGLHFSLADLRTVWRVAVPGALLQITASAALGFGVARLIGFAAEPAAALAMCLAVASTVVATRSLGERGRLMTQAGRIALGWLVVQDLVVVVALVVLPGGAPSPFAAAYGAVAGGAIKVLAAAVFAAVMLPLGRRLIPWILTLTARDGSRELFRLAVIVAALGIAYLAAAMVGVSPALGAFFAGVIIAESDVSHQAAGESVPVQQVFTVLFFVSVGMLFDPGVLLRAPWQVAAVSLMVVVGNALITLLALLALSTAPRGALEVAALLAQIGEFSFILSGAAAKNGLLSGDGRSLVLAAALISILLQPLMLRLAEAAAVPLEQLRFLRAWHAGGREVRRRDTLPKLDGHAIIIGHGRVGSVIAETLRAQSVPYIVIEQDLRFAQRLRREHVPVIYGDAAWPEVFEAAGPERARLLVIAIPEKSAVRRILAAAHAINPALDIVARTHSHAEADWLKRHGVGRVVMGESQTANEMASYAMDRFHATS
ncbi:MAG: cation:proton antiporter [Alphaproteobacteria bacterium]|nr:cation:proton antiporter [Alphaproteobacteria bacterium]